MKYAFACFLLLGGAAALVGCSSSQKNVAESAATEPMSVIFETDMGNDVDDALALAMLHNYIDQGRISLLGIGINKGGTEPAEYIDIVNTFYGHPTIPLGRVAQGVEGDPNAVNYAKEVVNMTTPDGKPMFARTGSNFDSLPLTSALYRRLLAEQPDSSVTMVSVGFSTNLAELLRTPADEISPLPGRDLVAQKVKLLSIMAGNAEDTTFCEFNVVKDIKAAQTVAREWPSRIVVSPFELGFKVLYPAERIENGFKWSAKPNPVVEGYRCYLPMPYDRPLWDLTSVLFAVEGGEGFTESAPMSLRVNDSGATIFTPDATGRVSYLMADSLQRAAIVDRLVKLTTFTPANHSKTAQK